MSKLADELQNENLLDHLGTTISSCANKLNELSGYKDEALKLREISELANRPLLVMILGEFKTGKSTFINALLQSDILKTDVTPATAVVTMITYGENRKVIAHLKDKSHKQFKFEELASITAEGDKSKKKLISNIKYVEIFVPLDILKSITIIDTPGLNVDNDQHAQATKEFMNVADFVFWVFAYGKAASRTEIASMSELSKRIKPTAIINRIDELDTEEESLEDTLRETQKKIGLYVEKVFGLSAKMAILGRTQNDDKMLKDSKWDAFQAYMCNIQQKSTSLKIKSFIEKLLEFIGKLNSKIRTNENEIKEYQKMFEDTTQYKEQLNKKKSHLIDIIEKSEIERLGNKKNLVQFVIKIKDDVAKLSGTESMVRVIDSYKDVLDEINSKYVVYNRARNQNSVDIRYYNKDKSEWERDLKKYNDSGLFDTFFLWVDGEKTRLNNRDADLQKRADRLKAESSRLDSIQDEIGAREKRLTSEVCEYLITIENLVKENVSKLQKQIFNYERDLADNRKLYNVLSSDIQKCSKIYITIHEFLSNSKAECEKIVKYELPEEPNAVKNDRLETIQKQQRATQLEERFKFEAALEIKRARLDVIRAKERANARFRKTIRNICVTTVFVVLVISAIAQFFLFSTGQLKPLDIKCYFYNLSSIDAGDVVNNVYKIDYTPFYAKTDGLVVFTSDTNIAKIDHNKLVAIKPGQVNIITKYKDKIISQKLLTIHPEQVVVSLSLTPIKDVVYGDPVNFRVSMKISGLGTRPKKVSISIDNSKLSFVTDSSNTDNTNDYSSFIPKNMGNGLYQQDVTLYSIGVGSTNITATVEDKKTSTKVNIKPRINGIKVTGL